LPRHSGRISSKPLKASTTAEPETLPIRF